jgi:hypothetical protein
MEWDGTEMKIRYGLFTFTVTVILVCLAACQAEEPDRASELAFKGKELYSWQTDAGEWHFSLLPGTNRIKTVEEVLANPLDQQGVEAALGELAAGEQVFWVIQMSGEDASVTFAFPPQSISDEIIQRAAEVDVHVTMVCN